MSAAFAFALLAVLSAPYQLATFRADVTVPLGHACMGGGISPATEVVDPLYTHGMVLLGPDKPLLFVAVDWCEISNDAYDHWRDALAEAAGTTRERVLLASVHQHDAPVADYEAQRLLDEAGLDKSLCDVAFARQCVDRVAAALKEALKSPRSVTHYGIGMARVEGVTSNRRVVLPDGTITYGRGSATKDPALQALPEGIIDPYLKTLSFWDGDTPLAAISAYSTHPMSYYGQGGVSADFVGMARARRQAEMPGVFQMYFTGCSATTAGVQRRRSEGRPVLADGFTGAWLTPGEYAAVSSGTGNAAVAPLNLVPKSLEAMPKRMHRRSGGRFPEDPARNLAAMALGYRRRGCGTAHRCPWWISAGPSF